jgi:hypothetical protein
MKRRSKSGGQTSKSRRPKTTAPKGRGPAKSIAGAETVVGRLTHERDQALLREAANFEILRLISKSPGDLETVFRTILEHATRICNADYGTLLLFENGAFRRIAHQNAPRRLTDEWQKNPIFVPIADSALDRLVKTKNTVHIDTATDAAL